MLCQKCHKNLATVRYAEVVDGKVANVNLCSECLAKQQDDGATGFELSGKAPEPKGFTIPQDKQARPAVHRTCPSCGMKQRDALRRERFGCRQCYDSFAEGVESRLQEVHGADNVGVSATGARNPAWTVPASVFGENVQTKRSLLRSALKMESYEEAAVLRDAIRGLEAQLAGGATAGRDAARSPRGNTS